MSADRRRGLAAILVMLGPPSAMAEVAWQDSTPYVLSTRGSKLAVVLGELGANHGIPVIVSARVDDRFVGTLRPMRPGQALDLLSRQYQLAWYHDGQALHVYKASEVDSRLVTPLHLPVATLREQLLEAGLPDPRHCRVRIVAASNAIEVLGVPACLERVTRFATRLDEQQLQQEQNQIIVRLFPLKYASAVDTDYSSRGKQVRIPGVASVLKDMAQAGLPAPLPSGKPVAAGNGSLPLFSAYMPQNAVLVRDRKINLPLYARLIEQLDRRPTLIEISVTLIDVNSEDLGALGVDWSASAGIGSASIRFNDNAPPDTASFSAVIANTAHFMLRLSALEQNAKAQILSRPSVVTLDNTTAVLDRNITFHTKLAAEKFASLESISTGSLLRVTPRLIREGEQTEIMLALQIQDGRQAAAVSQQEPLPQTLNAEISTQALLKAGQSLLLGGFMQDEQSEAGQKIPLLGDLPLLGRLFSSTRKNNRRTVRLFLIKAEPSAQS